MSKLLKIGVEYLPNYTVKLQDGTKKQEPCVMFFFDSDEKTSNIIAGSGIAKGLVAKGSFVKKAVKIDKYKDFIYGKKVFPKILEAYEKLGYVYDINNLNSLEASVEQEIKNVLDSDASNKIYSLNSSFIDEIIKAMEENMNDPKFMNYVNAVGSIQYVGDDVLSKATTLSYNNTVMVLSQWVNAGNNGAPRYLATRRQWSLFFNRDVISSATPLYIVNPKDVKKRSVKQTMSDYGVTQSQYDSNAMIRKQIDTLSNDKDYGQYNNHVFGLNGISPYYDYSQTVLQKGAQSNYDFDDTNIVNVDTDKDKKDDEKKGEMLSQATKSEFKTSESEILKNLMNYATKNNNNELLSILNGKNKQIINAIRYLAENSKTISREVDSAKKTLLLNVLVGLTLKRFKLNQDYSDKLLFNNRISGIKQYKALFNSLGSDFENIVYILSGLKESINDNLFIWMLNTLGISVNAYKNMPNDEKEAEESINNVTENFIKTFNKILLT